MNTFYTQSLISQNFECCVSFHPPLVLHLFINFYFLCSIVLNQTSGQQVGVLRGRLSCLQSSPDVLPKDCRVLSGLRPAQVGAFLHQFPHAVVWRQLMGWDLLQKQQNQHVFPLVKQTETATGQRKTDYNCLCGQFRGLNICNKASCIDFHYFLIFIDSVCMSY